MKTVLNQLLFRTGAFFYDVLTGQDHWRRQIVDMLAHLERRDGPLTVLDLGCGPGVSAFALAGVLPNGSRVTGVDLSPEMLARARHHHAVRYRHLDGVDFVEADATALPFEADHFDLITGHSFLYLVPDQVGVLREARRVLRPGGSLVFMEPNEAGSLWRAARQSPAPLDALSQSPFATARFAMSMALWRLVSGLAGRLDPDRVSALFEQAAFGSVQCHETLGGLGLHIVAT